VHTPTSHEYVPRSLNAYLFDGVAFAPPAPPAAVVVACVAAPVAVPVAAPVAVAFKLIVQDVAAPAELVWHTTGSLPEQRGK
jgi:hypothetical protein